MCVCGVCAWCGVCYVCMCVCGVVCVRGVVCVMCVCVCVVWCGLCSIYSLPDVIPGATCNKQHNKTNSYCTICNN